MMRLRPSRRHFPYARYTQRATPACARRCTLRRALRRVLQAHDFWCWFYVLVMLLMFLILEKR